MNITRDQIIDSLYKIMCTSTTTAIDNKVSNNDYFKRRVLGFKAEIEFEEELKKSDFSFLKGGILLSPRLDGSKDMKNKFAYITIDSLPQNQYVGIYSGISKWDEIEILYYAKINLEDWREENYEVKENKGGKLVNKKILVPSFKLFKFDRNSNSFKESFENNFSDILKIGNKRTKKSSKFHLRKREHFDYFKSYDLETLKKIYAERYFLDKKKNEDVIVNTIDLDGFITKKEKTFIVEIKEKTPIKPENIKSISNKQFWSYGWDTRRILWYSEVQKKTGFEIFYIVRQIENRKDRKFVQWDGISLNDYLKGISWSNSTGGGGGGDTLTVPYNHFLSLQKLLDKTYLL